MSGVLAWVAGSGVVQGLIIGATLAYLTTVLILGAVAKAETRTVHGWSAIRKVGQPGNGVLVRAALQKALPVVNVSPFWQMAISGAAIILAVIFNARGERKQGRIILKKAEAV